MKVITKEMLEKFQIYLKEDEKSKNTIDKYMRDIHFFVSWLEGRSIEKCAVLEYKKQLCENYAPKSVNSIISSLNVLFSFFNWSELKIKTLKIQKRIFTDKNKEMTKSEYERLLYAAKERKNEKLYYLMQTIASTGIRISELQYINTDAVKNGQVCIESKGKFRVVFLPRQLCKMLKKYMIKNNIKKGSVFVSKSGKPLNRSNVWKMLKNICEKADVSKEKVFPHNFRHLFARTFYSVQKDIVRLADILGHSNINTTRIYTVEDGEIHKKQIQRLGLLKC